MRNQVNALLDALGLNAAGKLAWKDNTYTFSQLDEATRAGKRAQWLRQGDGFGICLQIIVKALPRPFPIPDSWRSIRQVLGEERSNALVSEIVAFIESIPRRYDFSFPLHTTQPLGSDVVTLASNVALVTITETVPAAPTGGNLLSGLFGMGNAAPPNNAPITEVKRVVVRFRVPGYFEDSPENPTVMFALSMLRQFAALSFSAGYMGFKGQPGFLTLRPTATVADVTGGNYVSDFKTPEVIAGLLDSLHLSDTAISADLSSRVEGLPIEDLISGEPVSVDWRPKVLQSNFSPIMEAMHPRSKDRHSLRTAAEWLFDSHAEQNETAALLFGSIGLEAVLESPVRDVTERLADRLAYLLGKTPTQRNKLQNEYKTFYGVRSNLIHGRERRIGDDGRSKLQWARTTLASVIGHELEQGRQPDSRIEPDDPQGEAEGPK